MIPNVGPRFKFFLKAPVGRQAELSVCLEGLSELFLVRGSTGRRDGGAAGALGAAWSLLEEVLVLPGFFLLLLLLSDIAGVRFCVFLPLSGHNLPPSLLQCHDCFPDVYLLGTEAFLLLLLAEGS